VYELANGGGGWSESVLYSFCSQSGCADGRAPDSDVFIDGTGNIFGTTRYGGSTAVITGIGAGVVYKLDNPNGCSVGGVPEWCVTDLWQFCKASVGSVTCPDGLNPSSGFPLYVDSAGKFYGTTMAGGANGDGVVFKVGATEHVLHDFCYSSCGEGWLPLGGLVADSSGNLYGTTQNGGTSTFNGTVFEITP